MKINICLDINGHNIFISTYFMNISLHIVLHMQIMIKVDTFHQTAAHLHIFFPFTQ